MQVILLQRVAKLGQMGEVVTVKDGFARNFLLPQGKALRASAANVKTFELKKAQLEVTNLETKKEADAVGAKLDGQIFTVIRSASDAGALYGSVTTRDAAEAATDAGFTVNRAQVVLDRGQRDPAPRSCGQGQAERRPFDRRGRTASGWQIDPRTGRRSGSRSRI